jgi:hypothetical protein
MNRYDLLDTLLGEADASEILYQVISNMSNTAGVKALEQAAEDLGIDTEEEDDDDRDYDYDDDNDFHDGGF